MLEDRLLLWKIKSGDRDALRRLYEKYKDNLRTLAGAMLHDSQAGEDILHDVFVAFAENAGQFNIRKSLKSYLTTCVINMVRDEYRRRGPQRIDRDNLEQIENDTDCPAGILMAREKAQILADALAAIPYEQREVIVLRLKGGLKFREIARIQQVSLSTIQGRYKYGLKKLRTILDGELI